MQGSVESIWCVRFIAAIPTYTEVLLLNAILVCCFILELFIVHLKFHNKTATFDVINFHYKTL